MLLIVLPLMRGLCSFCCSRNNGRHTVNYIILKSWIKADRSELLTIFMLTVMQWSNDNGVS